MPDADLWYVMLADGDVHRVTLDQLDEAFQAGHIDQETLVLAEGARHWTQLGKLAGLEETPEPPRMPVTTSFRPVSIDLTDADPADLDLEDLPFRARSGKKWFAALGAVAMIATIAGVATTKPWWVRPAMANLHALVDRAMHRNSPSMPAVAALPPPAADPAPAVAPTPAPQPVSTSATMQAPAQPVAATAASDRFSPEQKQKLLDADKQLKAKSHARSVGPVTAHPSSKNKFGGFTTGGNKFDPLNSAIP